MATIPSRFEFVPGEGGNFSTSAFDQQGKKIYSAGRVVQPYEQMINNAIGAYFANPTLENATRLRPWDMYQVGLLNQDPTKGLAGPSVANVAPNYAAAKQNAANELNSRGLSVAGYNAAPNTPAAAPAPLTATQPASPRTSPFQAEQDYNPFPMYNSFTALGATTKPRATTTTTPASTPALTSPFSSNRTTTSQSPFPNYYVRSRIRGL